MGAVNSCLKGWRLRVFIRPEDVLNYLWTNPFQQKFVVQHQTKINKEPRNIHPYYVRYKYNRKKWYLNKGQWTPVNIHGKTGIFIYLTLSTTILIGKKTIRQVYKPFNLHALGIWSFLQKGLSCPETHSSEWLASCSRESMSEKSHRRYFQTQPFLLKDKLQYCLH